MELDWAECSYDLPAHYTPRRYPFLEEAGSRKNAGSVPKEVAGEGIQAGEVRRNL